MMGASLFATATVVLLWPRRSRRDGGQGTARAPGQRKPVLAK
jgi:hypothetical protein